MNTDWLKINQAHRSKIFTPISHLKLILFFRNSESKISIAGSQYSSGGQTLVDDGVIISMKRLKSIQLNDDGTYIAEAGACWNDVLTKLVEYNLVPAQMPSYSNFSVGGSISVNSHGRAGGRISDSIVWLEVITVDGNLYRCSSTKKKNLYNSIVGGYGLIGIIYRACLQTRSNLELTCSVIPSSSLNSIQEEIQSYSRNSILYNCDVTTTGEMFHLLWQSSVPPPDQKIILVEDELKQTFNYLCDSLFGKRQVQESTLTSKLGTRFGQNLITLSTPLHEIYQNSKFHNLHGEKRLLSYEMAYSAEDLRDSGFQTLLQEYFLPISQLAKFLKWSKQLIRGYQMHVLNQSIRYVNSSPAGYLDWILNSTECVSIVFYLVLENQKRYQQFTQEMIDLSLKLEGTWYLPYYPTFTGRQLILGYPKLNLFLQAKKKFDPDNKLSSKFWDYLISLF